MKNSPSVYLECDSSNVTCDSDEYFESWSYHTNDTNESIANNLYVAYNPDTIQLFSRYRSKSMQLMKMEIITVTITTTT